MKTGIKEIIIGAALFILGAIVVPVIIVLSFILGDSNEVRFEVPGNAQFTAEESGRYYLWNEYKTVFEGKSYNRSESIPDGMEIRISNGDTGELFDFVSDTSISSSVGSSSNSSIGYIEVQGATTVNIKIAGGSEERVFSFSQSRLLAMLGLFFAGFGISVIFGLSGVGFAIWGAVKVVKSNKQANKDDACV